MTHLPRSPHALRAAAVALLLACAGWLIIPREAPAAATPGRFVYGSGDATAVDTLTGLQWQRATSASKFVLSAALTHCGDRNLAGKKDWRLPTVRELASVRDLFAKEPAIDVEVFPGTKSDWYRTSSSPFGVSFSNGMVFTRDDNDPLWVRCVRG